MNGSRPNAVCTGFLCLVSLVGGRAAVAQSSSAANTATQAAGARSLASGVGMMPIPVPLFAPSTASAGVDGVSGSSGTSSGANLFSNPYAAPFLYSSMLPGWQPQAPTGSSTSQAQSATAAPTGTLGAFPAQMGLMMLATQRPLGIGSGRLSGARPGSGDDPRQSGGRSTARTSAGRTRGSVAHPGGLAARYFNRTGARSPYPQSYYNRQSRYFP
jgi:hypothetical protein